MLHSSLNQEHTVIFGRGRIGLSPLLFLLFLLLPQHSYAGDYPSGATATGIIASVGTFSQGMFQFVVTGTKDDGTSGSTVFWIDNTQAGASVRIANILAAAAQGKSVRIWNYGNTFSYGGQTGYTSEIEFVIE